MEAGNAEVEGLEEVAAQSQKRMLNYGKKGLSERRKCNNRGISASKLEENYHIQE